MRTHRMRSVLAKLVREEHEGCFVSIASEVLPEFREYETCGSQPVSDAVLMPDG